MTSHYRMTDLIRQVIDKVPRYRLRAVTVPEDDAWPDAELRVERDHWGEWIKVDELEQALAAGPQADMKPLASAMRKMLPPALLAEVVAHLDPLTPFVEFLRATPPAPPAVIPPHEPAACINCGERHDGGFESGWDGHINEGAVGPFCSQCWEFLRETFCPPPRKAEAPAVIREATQDERCMGELREDSEVVCACDHGHDGVCGYTAARATDDRNVLRRKATMREHTPGPWHWDGEFIVTIPHRNGHTSFGTNPEDARLIAAAPDLLAALKTLRIDANRLCDRNSGGTYEADCRRAIDVADAAIVKAEGRLQGESQP